MTHAADRFDWGAMYYRGIALGYDEGYAAYRADRAEQRWLRRRQGECPSGTTSEQVAIASKDSACESPASDLSCPKCVKSDRLKLLSIKPLDIGTFSPIVTATFEHYICLACGHEFENRVEATRVAVRR